MDVLAMILWTCMFFTPLFTVPFFWNYSKRRIISMLIALLVAVVLSALLFLASTAIFLRNGLGPG